MALTGLLAQSVPKQAGAPVAPAAAPVAAGNGLSGLLGQGVPDQKPFEDEEAAQTPAVGVAPLKLPATTISAAQPDNRPDNNVWSRLGQALLPHFLQSELNIAPEQRKNTMSTADVITEGGNAETIKQMQANPEKVDPLAYLRAGLSFGNNIDPTNTLTGIHNDITPADLPEAVTTPQKIAYGIGQVLTMSLAQPLIDAGAGALATAAGGGKVIQAINEAAQLSPWKIGYPLAVAKSALTGGLFGTITNNKQTLAKNILETAGTFAAFTALAYPIQSFFLPIISKVGDGIAQTNPDAAKTLTDPDLTQKPLAQTVWFSNPKDPNQLLKVTARGVSFTSKDAAGAALDVPRPPVMTSMDIEAFQKNPSLYDNLKAWVAGKFGAIKDVPFSPDDAIHVNATPVGDTPAPEAAAPEATGEGIRPTPEPGSPEEAQLQKVQSDLQAGKTPERITYELANTMSVNDAKELVAQAQATMPAPTAQPAAQAAPTPAPAQGATPAPAEPLTANVGENLLTKTPAGYQQNFAALQTAHDSRLTVLKAGITSLEEQVAAAKQGSKEKKDLKQKLVEAKSSYKTISESLGNSASAHALASHEFMTQHMQETHGLSPAQAPHAASDVLSHITNPELVAAHAHTSLGDIATRVAAEHKAKTPPPPKPELKIEPKAQEKPVTRETSNKSNKIEGLDPKQATKLTPEEAAPLAKKAAEQYWNAKIQPALEAGEAIVIGGDDLKDFFGNDYNDNNHPVFSKAAFDLYERALKESPSKQVIFTGGGAGSGKTELVVNKLLEQGFDGIIYDSNFSNYEGAKKQIEMAHEAEKDIDLYGVLPNVQDARGFTISREADKGRAISDNTFAHGHSGFPATVKRLLEEDVLKKDEVHLLDTRDVKGFDKAQALAEAKGYVGDPLATLQNLRYSKENIKSAYAKENYTKEGAYTGRNKGELSDTGVREEGNGTPTKDRTATKGAPEDSLKLVAKDAQIEGKTPPFLSRTDIGNVIRNNPEFKANPVLTVIEKPVLKMGFKDRLPTVVEAIDANQKVLSFEGKNTKFNITAKALGLVEANLTVGEKITLNPADFKTPGIKEFRIIKTDAEGKETIFASKPPEEKIPRSPKPKVEKKPVEPVVPLDPKEMINAEAEIEKGKPKGFAKTAFKELATLFNPVGQANARAVDVIMEAKGEYERALFRTEQTFLEVKKMWDRQPVEASLDFMDKVETGDIDKLPPQFQALAESYRERLNNMHAAAAQYKEIPFLEHFFPHLWEDKDAEAATHLWTKANAKRPFQGNKSFTKERVFATIQDGIKAGFVPRTTNPEELVQLYEQNVLKFVMANQIHEDLKPRGFSKYVSSSEKPPEGFTKIDDAITKVYGNPNIPILEAYDEHATNALDKVIADLGIANERAYNIGKRGVLGFTSKGSNSITTKFASPLSTKAHELGHQLHFKYEAELNSKILKNPAYQKDLRLLADLRYQGHDVTDGYKQYIRSGVEKMAVLLQAAIHAPELFEKTVPNLYKAYTDFLASKPELKPLLDIKPSLVEGVREDTIYAGGLVLRGEWYVEKNVARLINNFLSPNFLMDTALGQGIMNIKNTMNAFELGLSAFHFTMETLDTIVTKFSIGLTRIVHGDLKGFGDMLASPLAPITYFHSGQKFYNGDPELLKIEKDLFTGGASLRSKQYYKNTVFDHFNIENRKILAQIKRGEILPGFKGAASQILRLPLTAIEATLRPLFSYYIPRLKVGAFRNLFASELLRNSQRIQDGRISRAEVARNVWNNVENRMGELNYDNLFWNRNFKTSLMLGTRAVGWNLGTVRELGGAAFQDLPKSFGATKASRDDFKKYGFDFTPKMAYALSLFFVLGIVDSIYQYLHTHKYPGENDDGSFGGVGMALKDLYYPRNGAKTKSGEDDRVSMPTYLKDIVQSGVPALLTGHPFSAVDDFTKMLKNKSAPEASLIFDLLNNQDFYGNEIRNPHDNNLIQTKQVTIYLLSQLLPFSISQQQNLAAGKSTLEQQAEAFLGIVSAPAAVVQSVYDAQLAALYGDQVGGYGSQTPEAAAQQAQKSAVVAQIKKGDYSGVQGLLDAGIIKPAGLRTFIANALLTTPQKEYKGLSAQNKATLLNSQ